MKKLLLLTVMAFVAVAFQANAQDLKIKGVAHNNRYDDGEQMVSSYLGWNSELGKAIFIVDYGIYSFKWDGSALTTPEKEPEVKASAVKGNSELEEWANNFNMMYGNSGAVYVDGKITTVFSRDEQSTTDEELFRVCQWDANTGELLSNRIFPKSACVESSGMAYNPIDGKVYGLFYLTEQELGDEITSDPDFFTDTDGDASATDAGYCICTIDLRTMEITPVTPGLYYYNFVTFAINSEGRAFALTSGGSSGAEGQDGVLTDVYGNRTGAQLCEFDLSTGLMIQEAVDAVDPETQEHYTEYVHPVGATGYASQYRRQAACFDKNNPNKMYWVGYYNSGKGVNEWGSWTSLSDKEWRTNGKYDTALYEVDITTGEAVRLSKVKNRFIFSALWIDGADNSDGAEETGISSVKATTSDNVSVYNLSGQQVYSGKDVELNLPAGIYVVKTGDKSNKVVVR